MNEIKETMSIILKGENEVDIETFSSTLSHTTKVLKKSAQYSVDGEYQKFVIKDVRKGSFIVDLAAVVPVIPDLLQNTATAISMFKTFLDIKKHLNGEKPKKIIEEENTYSVENNEGTIINIGKVEFNSYTDSKEIDENVTKLMKALSKDDAVTGLELIIDRNGEKIKQSYDPDKLSSPFDVSQITDRISIEVVRQNIKLAKLDFVGNSKWQAYVNTDLVSVKMYDEEFKTNIADYSFSLGTVLDVDLEIQYYVDTNGIPIPNKKAKYIILKVHNVLNVEKNEQLSMNFLD